MQAIQEARTIIASKKNDVETGRKLIEYAKKLMTNYRSVWFPPPQNTFVFAPSLWTEELMLVAFRLSDCFLKDPKGFVVNNLATPFISILLFGATQLRQLDIVAPIIDKLLHNLICADLLVPYFVFKKNKDAVSLFLESFAPQMKDSTVLLACLYLAQFPDTLFLVKIYLDRLKKKFPIQVTYLKALLLIRTCTPDEYATKGQEAIDLLKDYLPSNPQDHQLLYNLAFLSALAQKKVDAFEYIQQSIKINTSDSRALLLMIRILHANCQYTQALSIAKTVKSLLDRYDKNICKEVILIAAESGDSSLAEEYFHKLQNNWPKNTEVMNTIVRLNLMYGKIQSATEHFQAWSEFDQQSADFFYCYSQLCFSSKDYLEAEKYMSFAIEQDPCRAELHVAYAEILKKNDKLDMAIDRIHYAIEIDPFNIPAWVVLSGLLTGEESNQALQKAIELRNNYIDLSGLDMMLFPTE